MGPHFQVAYEGEEGEKLRVPLVRDWRRCNEVVGGWWCNAERKGVKMCQGVSETKERTCERISLT